MRIELEQRGAELGFELKLSEEDHSIGEGQRESIQLGDDAFRFILPFSCEVHPDLLATALLSVMSLRFPIQLLVLTTCISLTIMTSIRDSLRPQQSISIS